MINADAAERFMAAPWLKAAPSEIKRTVLGALAEERAPEGTILLAQGQPNDHLSFLIEGTVEIDRLSNNDTRRDLITSLVAPSVFGATSFFQPRPPMVSVRATSDVWLLTLHHSAHEELRREHPRAAEALAAAILQALCERFDLIEKLFTDFIARHPENPGEVTTEWSRFRSRLFEDHSV